MFDPFVPVAGVLALVLTGGMMVFQIMGACGAKVGLFLWNGENEVLTKKFRILSIVFAVVMAIFLFLEVFTAKFLTTKFPVNGVVWFTLVPLGYYFITYVAAPPKAKYFNMIWSFLLALCLLLIAYCY